MFFLDTYIYIKKVTLKEIKTMKNILAENLLRFGVKNLNETDVKILSESLLLEQTQQVTNAINALNTALKAKPTTVGGSAKVYPVVSINWTSNATPPNGGDGAAISKELPFTVTKWSAGNLPVGSKMPISIKISAGMDDVDKTSDVYKTFLRNISTNWKRVYKFAYNRSENPSGDANDPWLSPKVSTATKQLVAAINRFYIVDKTKSIWWDVPGVDASPSGNSVDFTTQFDQLCRTLSAYPYGPVSF